MARVWRRRLAASTPFVTALSRRSPGGFLYALAAHLTCWLLVAVFAFVVGKAVSPKTARGDLWGEVGLAVSLGLGVLASAVFVLGLPGLLSAGPVGLTLLVLGLSCWKTWRDSACRAWRWLRDVERRTAAGRFLPVVLGAVLILPPVALALYPPTEFDANVYHLPYARAFVEEHRLHFLPSLRYPVFPQLWEMLYCLALLATGDLLAQLLHLLAVFAAALLIVAWGRHSFSPRVGLWAGALWLGTPLVLWIGAAAYVDLGLTLFVTASLYAWERWREDRQTAWLCIAGLCAGFAAATKYLGLFFLVALLVLTAFESLRRRLKAPVVQYASLALLAAAPWYGRLLYYTGNPLFPYYSGLFGPSEWMKTLPPGTGTADGAGLGASMWAFLGDQVRLILQDLPALVLAPWNSIFHREVFHFQAPLSPVYLVLLPLCLPLALGSRQMRRLLAVVLLYGLFWLTTIQDVRFLLPTLPVLVLAMARGLDRGWRWITERRPGSRRLGPWLAPALALLFLLPGYLYAGYKLWRRGALPMDETARQEYLVRQVPGYEGVRYLNQTAGPAYTVYALYGENLNYLAEGEFLGDWFGPARYSKVLAVLNDGEALHAVLEELGAGYFLVLRGPGRVEPARDGSFPGHFELLVERPDFLLYALKPRGTP